MNNSSLTEDSQPRKETEMSSDTSDKSNNDANTDLANEEDDLIKLQEEIRKMEEEAARIAKETEVLNSQHKTKGDSTLSTGVVGGGNGQTTGNGSSSASATASAPGQKRDGYVTEIRTPQN